MATKLIHKKSSVADKVPLPGDLEAGELALNLTDKKIYSKTAGGTVVELGGAQINDAAVSTTTTYSSDKVESLIAASEATSLSHTTGAISVDVTSNKWQNFVADTHIAGANPAFLGFVEAQSNTVDNISIDLSSLLLQEGDVVIAYIADSNTTPTEPIVSSGYTDRRAWTVHESGSSTAIGFKMVYKVMGPTPDSVFTVDTQTGAGIRTTVQVLAYRNLDSSAVFDVGQVYDLVTSPTSTPDPSAITPISDDSLLLTAVLSPYYNQDPATPPSGYTLVGHTRGYYGAWDGATINTAHKVQSSAGTDNPGNWSGLTATYHVLLTDALRKAEEAGEKNYTVDLTSVPVSTPWEVFLTLEVNQGAYDNNGSFSFVDDIVWDDNWGQPEFKPGSNVLHLYSNGDNVIRGKLVYTSYDRTIHRHVLADITDGQTTIDASIAAHRAVFQDESVLTHSAGSIDWDLLEDRNFYLDMGNFIPGDIQHIGYGLGVGASSSFSFNCNLDASAQVGDYCIIAAATGQGSTVGNTVTQVGNLGNFTQIGGGSYYQYWGGFLLDYDVNNGYVRVYKGNNGSAGGSRAISVVIRGVNTDQPIDAQTNASMDSDGDSTFNSFTTLTNNTLIYALQSTGYGKVLYDIAGGGADYTKITEYGDTTASYPYVYPTLVCWQKTPGGNNKHPIQTIPAKTINAATNTGSGYYSGLHIALREGSTGMRNYILNTPTNIPANENWEAYVTVDVSYADSTLAFPAGWDWHENIDYTTLQPGQYRFRIVGSENGSVTINLDYSSLTLPVKAHEHSESDIVSTVATPAHTARVFSPDISTADKFFLEADESGDYTFDFSGIPSLSTVWHKEFIVDATDAPSAWTFSDSPTWDGGNSPANWLQGINRFKYYCLGDSVLRARQSFPVLPSQVSASEITAGTETATRLWSPQDVHTMIDTHESAGGGGGNIAVDDEGVQVSAATSRIDFTGSGVTATESSGTVTVNIPGGSGGSPEYISARELGTTTLNGSGVVIDYDTDNLSSANMSLSGGVITYAGSTTIQVSVDAYVGCAAPSTTRTAIMMSIQTRPSGGSWTTVASGKGYTRQAADGGGMSCHAIVELDQDDEIRVLGSCSSGTIPTEAGYSGITVHTL